MPSRGSDYRRHQPAGSTRSYEEAPPYASDLGNGRMDGRCTPLLDVSRGTVRRGAKRRTAAPCNAGRGPPTARSHQFGHMEEGFEVRMGDLSDITHRFVDRLWLPVRRGVVWWVCPPVEDSGQGSGRT